MLDNIFINSMEMIHLENNSNIIKRIFFLSDKSYHNYNIDIFLNKKKKNGIEYEINYNKGFKYLKSFIEIYIYIYIL